MKKISLYIIIAVLVSSCSKSHFEELLLDPNRPTSVHPSLLLTGIEVNAFGAKGSNPCFLAHLQCNSAGAKPEQYFTFDRGNFGDYNNLLQVQQMEAEAQKRDLKEYLAISQFFKAYFYYVLTMTFGDVPYSQAMQATKDNFSPTYDAQKSVITGILAKLDSANTTLKAIAPANANPVTGDVIYAGNTLKWRKLINSFRLRVLMALSAKTADTDLKIVSEFAKVFKDPDTYPIFQGNGDGAMLTYSDIANNRYPLYQATDDQRTYIEKKLCDFLINVKDPRLFSFANITSKAKTAGSSTTDFSAYAGVDGSQPYPDLAAQVISGNYSLMNSRYIFNAVNEPNVAVGYPELQFNLAEAAARGWIPGDAESFYKNGIKASMDFYATYGGYTSGNYFDAMYANDAVKYDPVNGLDKILLQKYISFYMNSGYEAWYNLRRTGKPVLKLDGGGVQNNGKLPLRYMYPQAEINTNTQHLNNAITRQFSTDGDKISSAMWLLKP